jgi:hypothetical protein
MIRPDNSVPRPGSSAAKQTLLRTLSARARIGFRAYRARYWRVHQPELGLIGSLCDRTRGSIDIGGLTGLFTFLHGVELIVGRRVRT